MLGHTGLHKIPLQSNPPKPNQTLIEHPSTMSPASNTSKEAVTVGTRLFCQRPELFPKDTTRPLYAKPQSEHSLTRDTQWVGGSQNQHRTAAASHAAPEWPDRENQPTQEEGIPAQKVPLTGSNPQNRTETQIEHPSTMSPASNTSKEAVTVGTRLFLPKTRVISQRHNQAPNAPAPTWNRQLLRPNHCSWPTSQRRGTNRNACR